MVDVERTIIKPRRLERGDAVGVISPSTAVSSRADLSRGMRILESLGFKPKLSPRALNVSGAYLAGTREDRLADIRAMFLDDEVRGIFCTGGGFAAIQLLPDMDWELIRKHPKTFVGYSDITTLLLPLAERAGLISFHGPMIQGLNPDTKGGAFTARCLKQALMRGKAGALAGYTEWKVLRPGRAEGTLIGGNLTSVASLLGTPYEPRWDGKILFWEEVDETIEGLDNLLWRLRVAKVFKRIEGMVVGKITGLASIDDESETWPRMDHPPTIESVILSATDGFNFPVLYGVDFGHDVPSLTLPVGAKALLTCPAMNRVGKLAVTEDYLI